MSKTAKHILKVAVFAVFLAACGPEKPETERPAPVATNTPGDNAPAAEQFAAVHMPTSGTPHVYGAYTHGCIAGAVQLPADAPHWQVLNAARNRAWGHPTLIRFIRNLADEVAADGNRGLLIGDLAQPRGGPLPSDHNSHQVGLDADIWLTPLPPRRLSAGEIENFEPPTMVDLSALKVDTHLFGATQYAMLKRAAEAPEVERIFVSPPIKQALCKRAPKNDRAWLRKLRPWRGHTAHMHVRLACPADSTTCTPQDPPPEGDGCGAELASWFKETSWTKEGSTPYSPETAIRLDALPSECRQLLSVERDRG